MINDFLKFDVREDIMRFNRQSDPMDDLMFEHCRRMFEKDPFQFLEFRRLNVAQMEEQLQTQLAQKKSEE